MDDLTLVTGATGFIGSHLVRALLARGEGVRVLVRGGPERLAPVGLGDEPDLDVAVGDLLDPSTLAPALEGVRRVYHVAGLVTTSRKERDRVHRLNVDATVNLFDAIRRAAVERTVYLASIFALGGGAGGRPADETVAYDLEDLDVDYVRAKRRAELHALRCRDEGMPLVFVYPTFCYGPGDVNRSSSKLIDMHLSGLLMASFRGGQNVMDVRDAARGLVLGMDAGRVGEQYLVGGENLSYERIGAILSSITGRPRPRLAIPAGPARLAGRLAERFLKTPPVDEGSILLASRYWYYDDSKARRELGHSSRPAEQALRDAVEWIEGQRRAGRR